MGLGVVHHLDAVLDLAVFAVMGGKLTRDLGWDPALGGQRGQRIDRAARAQVGVASSRDQLLGLGEELDLADAAPAQLEVMARHADAVQPLVVADAAAHLVRVLDGGEVEMPPPDKGPQRVQEAPARREVARADPRLDIGRAFPAAPLGLVIVQRRAGRDADRRHRGIGPQPQVGAEDIALRGQVRQRGRGLAGGADQGGADLVLVAGRIGRVVVKDDQVDVRGIVQLARAHLAHGQREDAGRVGRGPGRGRRQLAAPRLVRDMGAQGEVGRAVGQVGQHARDLVQRPDAAQVGQRRVKGDPPLGLPQRGAEVRGGQCLEALGLGEGQPGGGRVAVQRLGQPARLALDQPGQVGARARRPPQKVGQPRGRPRQPGGSGGATRLVGRKGQAGDAVGKAHVPSLRPPDAASMRRRG